MQVEDEGSTQGCSNPKYCKDRDPNRKKDQGKGTSSYSIPCIEPGICGGTAYSHEGDPLKIFGGETIFWGLGADLVSWDETKQIDPKEWEALLSDTGYKVNRSWIKTGWRDTPLFNGFGFLSGRACLNPGNCYDRSELNYIGEGEALAALGLSKEGAHNVVWAWKNKGPFVLGLLGFDSTPREVSQGTYEMTDVGWDYYHDQYLSP